MLVPGVKSGTPTALTAKTESKLLNYIRCSRQLCNTLDKHAVLQIAADLERVEAQSKDRAPRWPAGKASESGTEASGPDIVL